MTFPKSACAKQKDVYSKTENRTKTQTSLVTMCSQEKLTHDSISVVLGLAVVWIWMKCLRIRQPRNTTHFQFTLTLWRKTVCFWSTNTLNLWKTLKMIGLQTEIIEWHWKWLVYTQSAVLLCVWWTSNVNMTKPQKLTHLYFSLGNIAFCKQKSLHLIMLHHFICLD